MPNLPAARVNRSRPFQKVGLDYLGPLKEGRSTINFSTSTLSQLHTIITEIEAILNSRPLTSLLFSADAIPLRPIDFISPEVTLQLNIPGAQADFNYLPQGSTQESLVAWHQETLAVLERFWDVCHRDYLSALAKRHQSRISQSRSTPLAPKVGHLVIMADDSLPRGRWPLAIIVELHSDKNNTVRTAIIRTARGKTLKRSINHLYPLEITASQKKYCGNPILLT
ncbi:hypothetical protein ANCCAN_06522 [Ancylostoma caninum]|uniref:DUF5641 domain-containing protein n=1 Tax=Ancylostoma caninum TaxID=29170 RepID=A0A368GUV3_ANCCA|nr:hypothetical protein ANCCAN_06522 [Ancylostoma caninum]